MTTYVLDTNILSLVLRKNVHATKRLLELQNENHLFVICPAVWYEVHRGLLHRDTRAQMSRFVDLVAQFEWQHYTREDWRLAAETWARLRASGRQIADADLLIAVFALNRDAVLVTDNTADFAGLRLLLDNWKTPPAAG
jgi:tRNA(fMet)-specific endonuclease VapC